VEDPNTLKDLLDRVASGDHSATDAQAQLQALQAQPLGFATIDHHRAERCGECEVIFAAGKTADQVAQIAQVILEKAPAVLLTRATTQQLDHLEQALGDVPIERGKLSGTAILGACSTPVKSPGVRIVTAGTSDLPVAEEAAMTCKAMGQSVVSINDVGVAGIHRLLHRAEEIRSGRVIIVIAGMEGALPSVVGGMVDVPVIAVTTSVGYGASLVGIAALLGMLNTCAAGVTVVNIDNGFGAAVAACRISRQAKNNHEGTKAAKEDSEI